MKRVGNLYETAFTLDALYEAYLAARHQKRAGRACHEFERRLGSNLQALHLELADGSYRPRPYYSFVVKEPKPRTIHAPAFRDLVVQHAIYRVAGPILDRTFIDQSFACRKGLGTHAASDYAQEALRQSPTGSYTLKLDIRKFFYRIDRGILRRLIERRIKDARLVDLMMRFADHGEEKGIPIGSLVSQLYALLYLNPLDHFVKRELGVKHYCRYVDDFVLFGLSRERALECRARIVAFLAGLGLELSKSTIARTTRGLNFVGYRTWAGKRFVRRRALFNFRRSLASWDLPAVASYLGHAKRTHSERVMRSQATAAGLRP
jgi:retron-type reverse transcriptase